jgi:hypothetical protein
VKAMQSLSLFLPVGGRFRGVMGDWVGLTPNECAAGRPQSDSGRHLLVESEREITCRWVNPESLVRRNATSVGQGSCGRSPRCYRRLQQPRPCAGRNCLTCDDSQPGLAHEISASGIGRNRRRTGSSPAESVLAPTPLRVAPDQGIANCEWRASFPSGNELAGCFCSRMNASHSQLGLAHEPDPPDRNFDSAQTAVRSKEYGPALIRGASTWRLSFASHEPAHAARASKTAVGVNPGRAGCRRAKSRPAAANRRFQSNAAA